MPSNLAAGSLLPEPLLFGCAVGNLTRPAWSQVINDTQRVDVLGVSREANYIHWTFNLDNEIGQMSAESECLFDVRTGVMLSLNMNFTWSYLGYMKLVVSSSEVHEYKI